MQHARTHICGVQEAAVQKGSAQQVPVDAVPAGDAHGTAAAMPASLQVRTACHNSTSAAAVQEHSTALTAVRVDEMWGSALFCTVWADCQHPNLDLARAAAQHRTLTLCGDGQALM